MTTLLLSDHGSYIGKSKEQLKISFGMSDKPISYIPATKVDGIIIDAKVTISSGAFELMRNYGITVIWQDHKDDDGMILQPFNSHGSVDVRRNQYNALEDERGVIFASQVVYAACMNKLTMIKRLERNRIGLDIPNYLIDDIENKLDQFTTDDAVYDKLTIDCRQFLMNTEAQIAKLYYNIIGGILEQYNWEFDRRSRRPAKDPYNALLNYGYAILKGRLTQSLAISGLDIYGGYLHTDRSGRESLVLDIMEEFRQIAVDEVILKLLHADKISNDDFKQEDDGILITKELKQIYVPAIFDQFDTYFNELSLSHHFINQGRELASFLRGVSAEYHPFLITIGDPW